MKAWQIKPHYSDDLVKQLLFNRGLNSEEEINEFFNPSLDKSEEFFSLSGLQEARKRILQAVENKELIIVFGDYDVDGTCGTAILYHGLTAIGAKVLPYIPHREKEGYGLSKEGLDYAKEKGANLVITVDNGIVALEQAKYSKEIGIDLIITDHHLPVEEKPAALVIVHSTEICGAAVGWCLVKALVSKEQSDELLDLVAIATIGDMMPLIGVNRALVVEGLKVVNRTKRVGLKALITEAKLKLGEVDAFSVGYILGPRLNAIGRLEHALDTVRLLCTKDVEKAYRLAKLLCETNDQKKKLTADAIVQAKEMLNGLGKDLSKKKILIMHSPEWIPGIIGLVAARITEEYRLPSVIISQGEVQSKGSARSVDGLDIVSTIRQCADLLIDVGGHPKAAGFTVENTRLEEFKNKLETVVEVIEINSTPTLDIEAVVENKKINKKLAEEILSFEPCGIANPKPVIAAMNMKVTDIRTVGNGQHLKFKADNIDAIAFSMGNLSSLLKEGQLINVAFNLEINRFNGNETLQLKVVDVQFS